MSLAPCGGVEVPEPQSIKRDEKSSDVPAEASPQSAVVAQTNIAQRFNDLKATRMRLESLIVDAHDAARRLEALSKRMAPLAKQSISEDDGSQVDELAMAVMNNLRARISDA